MVKHDAAYLKKLRSCKSLERAKPTIEKVMKTKEHPFYDLPPRLDEEEEVQEMTKVKDIDHRMRPRVNSQGSIDLWRILYFTQYKYFMRNLK